MSSIIDALKKSDKNRTTETGANINQIKFSNEPPEKNRRGFWLLVIILLLIASGVLAWQQGWHHKVMAKAHQWLGNNDTNNPVTAEQKPPQVSEGKPKAQLSASKPAKTKQVRVKSKAKVNDNKLTPPKPDDVKAKTVMLEEPQHNVEITKKPKRKNSRKTKDRTKPITDEITLVSDKKPETAKSEDPKQTTDFGDRKILEPKLKQDYLLIHQIDFEIRKNIPPIKLNIHIYDPDPANRMIIMNGVKFVAGDIIEELVKVNEIVKEGVVLEFDNIQFLVPK